ncbi:MAG: multidrug ABC transporter permease, partial [Pseudomonadota bacterium]
MKNPPPHNFENRSLPLRDPRSFAFMNMIGMITLYRKEVLRFLNVSVQTILAPVVTSFLFLIIFTLALGRAVQEVHGVGFSDFLAPGLIIMTMAQNAFANTSSSLIISKTQGNIVDVLMPPVSAGEFLVAYTMAAITRGMLVGLAITLAMLVLIDLHVVNLFLVIIFGLLGSLMLGLLGLIGGIWAEKFDHI